MAQLASLLIAVCALGAAVAYPNSVLSNSLLKTLNERGNADVAIILKSDVSSIYDEIASSGLVFSVRGERMAAIRAALIEYTSQSQANIRSLLDGRNVAYKTFWITNRIIVSAADAELVKLLSSHPDVVQVREEIVIPLEPLTRSEAVIDEEVKQNNPVRGVWIVKGHELWAENITGEGIVTSNIDTGVRGTHMILRDNFLGEYGWYDPSFRTSSPNDGNGHGARREGFGMAPDSRWMACKGCATSSCAESDLLGCGQFIACPTLTDGTGANCTKAPHVVGNSWGSSLGGQDWYDDVITGWHSAGVIPVFSAGNAGSSCGSVGSPGDRQGVIGVAATDMSDVIASFSSRGPATGNGGHKPEMSAPGVDVLSSMNAADDHFDRLSGTSMASPHVTGGVALLIQKNPLLQGDYDAVRTALFEGAETTTLTGSSQTCGGLNDDTFPNHVFGYGRLDVVASSKK
ncbi:Bacillopeptidase F [Folsomia candida]|uniref:Bacillopeptidase F n=1 Tax=Folsomia candida TaxID=158441 RepID=A0A226ER82_FOLCA|nr:Bacillopeptidase F [Folsomia candida]